MNTKTIGYNVTYTYIVDNKDYANTEFIKPGSEIRYLFDQYSPGDICRIEICFSPEKPEESLIADLIIDE